MTQRAASTDGPPASHRGATLPPNYRDLCSFCSYFVFGCFCVFVVNSFVLLCCLIVVHKLPNLLLQLAHAFVFQFSLESICEVCVCFCFICLKVCVSLFRLSSRMRGDFLYWITHTVRTDCWVKVQLQRGGLPHAPEIKWTRLAYQIKPYLNIL